MRPRLMTRLRSQNKLHPSIRPCSRRGRGSWQGAESTPAVTWQQSGWVASPSLDPPPEDSGERGEGGGEVMEHKWRE